MKYLIIALISLAIVGNSFAQDNDYLHRVDSVTKIRKKYDVTKKNCIHMDTVLTAMKKTQQDQLTIIDKLKAIKERQITVQTTNEPR